MSLSKIAFRYAKSLLDLSMEKKCTERILRDMRAFQGAMESRDFYLLLQSPIIQPGKKSQVIRAIFAESMDAMTLAFVDILVRKGREQFLPEVANSFIDQYNALHRISRIKLTTAVALDEAALDKIKQKLQGAVQHGGSLEIETAVNERLIGGFTVEMEDKILDASIAHQLDQVRKELTRK